MKETRTPHDIAQDIAAKNVKEMKKGSGNTDGVGGGEQAANAFAALITHGLCSSCARLCVDDDKQIGCSYEFNSPAPMARPLLGGVFLHEQSCRGYIEVDSEMQVFTDGDDVTRYNYK